MRDIPHLILLEDNMKIDLKPGDMFCTANPSTLGKMINSVQSAISYDGESLYSHAGIITNSKGDTFEALWTLNEQNLFEKYSGVRVAIARWIGLPELNIIGMNDVVFDYVYNKLHEEHDGQFYPGWRLLFNIVPPLAKLTSFKGKFVVCSELVAKFLYYVHDFVQPDHDCENEYCWPRHKWFTGTSPDMICDEWHRWNGFAVLYEKELDPNDFT